MVHAEALKIRGELRARRVSERARISVVQVAAVKIFPAIDPCRRLDRPRVARRGQFIYIVVWIEEEHELQLLEIVQALDSLRLDFRFRQGREQHRRQYCDNGNDHQQFSKRECPADTTIRLTSVVNNDYFY